jgi:hypothetical protein
MVAHSSSLAAPLCRDHERQVVEISLLLPSERLQELLAISQREGMSIAQMLRVWIDRGVSAHLASRVGQVPCATPLIGS